MDTTITHLSLCSGYEGIGLGLRRVFPGLREIAYVEREGFPIANLVAKMEAGELDAAPVFTDVKTFPYGKFRGLVDILSGGFPCQPFSAAGKREGVEDPRHLFPYIRDGIAQCRPRFVFLENVEGIISSKTADGESVLKYVLSELEGLGYRATAGIFSAAEVGAPHQRKRVFILAYRNSVRHDRRELSDRNGERSLPEQAQSRPGQPVVWSEAEGCCGEPRSETELAHRISEGLEGHSGDEQGEERQGTGQGRPTTTSGLPPRWPARPGEEQYEWEEPRVVADSKDADDTPGKYEEYKVGSQIKHRGGCVDSEQKDKCEAQSELGRTTHGSSSRVDRLRLLGNGVVPQVAAKAFITLLNKL